MTQVEGIITSVSLGAIVNTVLHYSHLMISLRWLRRNSPPVG